MAKLPGAITAPNRPQQRSTLEQILIGLVGQLPQVAFQGLAAKRAGEENARQLGVLEAEDSAALGLLGGQGLVANQPGAEGQAMAAFLEGAGLRPQMPDAFADQSGLHAIPREPLSATRIEELKQTPGALAALGTRGQAAQVSALQSEVQREGIATQQQARTLAMQTAERAEELHPFAVKRADLQVQLEELGLRFENETFEDRKAIVGQQLANAQRQYQLTYDEEATNLLEMASNRVQQFVQARATQLGIDPMTGAADLAPAMVEAMQLWPMYRPDVDIGNVSQLLQLADAGDEEALAILEGMQGDGFAQGLSLTGVFDQPIEQAQSWRNRISESNGNLNQVYDEERKIIMGDRSLLPERKVELMGQLETSLNLWRMLELGETPVVFTRAGLSDDEILQIYSQILEYRKGVGSRVDLSNVELPPGVSNPNIRTSPIGS